jgi:hypothetical protein
VATSELGSSASVAGALRCKRALADEEMTTVQILGTDVNEEWQSVVATVSRDSGGGMAESSEESWLRGSERRGEVFHGVAHVRVRSCRRGAALVGVLWRQQFYGGQQQLL